MKAAKRRRVTLKTENAVNRKNNQNRFGRHALSSCLNARHCGRNRVGTRFLLEYVCPDNNARFPDKSHTKHS